MKKVLLFCAALLLALTASAQTLTQQGTCYRYNGKNPRTPLSNVLIKYGNGNNTTKSDDNGYFELQFTNLRMGDRIGMVTVTKREMMVFNQQAVDEWSIRKEPLCLILCDANEFELQKQNLIEIGKREAQKKYDRQKAGLEQQLAAAQIDQARYEAELDKAYEELARLREHLDEYADLFARIDQSEIDTTAQQAMDLFNQGQVDEAIHLFEQGNYLEKLRKARTIKKQAKGAIAQIKQAEAAAEQDSVEAIQSLKAQIAAYKVQYEWEKAGALLKGLADELNTDEAYYEYAFFCQGQNNFDEAERYYSKALEIRKQLARANPLFYELDLAYTMNNLANLYRETRRYTESEAMFHEALAIFRRLAKSYPLLYEPILAGTLSNLSALYTDTQRHAELA